MNMDSGGEPVYSSGSRSESNIEESFWEYAGSSSGIMAAGVIGIATVVILIFQQTCFGSAKKPSKFRALWSYMSRTVGIIAIAAMTAFMQQYIRVSEHFQTGVAAQSPNGDEIDTKPGGNGRLKFSCWTILKHLTNCGQRMLTFRAALLIVTNSGWSYPVTTIVSIIILIPRLLFSIFIISNIRDLRRARPKDPNRAMDMSIRLLHYANKGFRHFYQVLSGAENVAFSTCKQFLFVSMQLLGYSYNDRKISTFGELETAVFIGWNFLAGSELYNDSVYVSSLIIIILLRICLWACKKSAVQN